MHDVGKVLLGLIIFLALITFPIWFNVAKGKATYVPELAKPVKGNQCVADTEYMKASHMDLLNQWRDEVVRHDDRIYTSPTGEKFNKSLSHTCLDCHSDKANFCDKCHSYMAVDPYCWDCHIIPKELK